MVSTDLDPVYSRAVDRGNGRVWVYGRASYLNAFKPRAPKGSTREKYSVKILFPKGYDLAALIAICEAALDEKFGKGIRPKTLKTPFKKQDAANNEGETDGAYAVNASTEQPPGLIMPDARTHITDPAQLFSGCWCIFSVNAYAYDNVGQGVSVGLQNIQLIRTDKPLGGGRIAPEIEFAPASQDDVTVPVVSGGTSSLLG